MIVSDPLVLEPTAARAWPAALSETLGGWRLHASSGFSGRINSCWPLGSPGMAVPQAVAAVEAWYAARALPPLFKAVETLDGADELIACLKALGYRSRTETLTMASPTALSSGADVQIGETLCDDFTSVFSALGGDPADTQAPRSAGFR